MNAGDEARMRRNYVSNMYSGLGWKERVANMPPDQITAIYLRARQDNRKPKSELTKKSEIQSDQDGQLRLW